MKKLFLLIMASLSIAGSMNAQTPVKVRDNLYCYLFQYPNSSEAWVTSGGEPYTGNVEIPQNFWYNGATYEVTKIGDDAFKNCVDLTSVTIPNSVTEIGKSSFQNCGLLSLDIPSSVTSIGEEAFYGCSELATITVDEGNTVYDSRGGCNAIIRKSDNTLLFGCKNTVIPSSVKAIGDYAFRSCTGMTTLEIPEGVTTIGQDAFDYCTNLASLTIPASVTSIGVNAFMECDALTSVTVAWVTPLNISSKYAFYGCDKLSTATLYVPNGRKGAYSNASYGWNVFGKIEGYGEELPADVEINATNFPDQNFRNYLLAQDYGKDGILTITELDNLKTLDVSDMGIVTLKGIEHFTNLMFFTCHSNSLASLDLSQNTKLTNLHCSSNSLTSLDLSHNTGLLNLYCSENNLESLDLSKNTALVYLACPLNKLTSLDVSSCPNLGYLSCDGNNITGDAMTTLVNSLPERTTASDFFVCSDKCSPDNTITTAQAKVAKDKKWTVKKETASGWVEYAGFDPIAINETNFPDANFRFIVRDKAINTNEDDYLSEKEVLAVTKLSVGSKEISNMKGIEYFTALQELICGQNHGLTSLNVSANKALTKLDCSACGLTSLDVSQNTALKELICYNNSLTSLDVSTNTALELLRCEYNTLTSLTVSKTNNTALKDVYCGGNQISGAAMTNLVNGLPTVTGDHGFNVCDDTQKTDNVITPAQVKTATDKGWMVLKFNGSWASPYAGQGDVNCDNKINQDDVTLTVNIIMGQKPATVGEFAGDLNHDGKTDAADIVLMNNILNGK